jgi:hypothetical protein
MKIECTCFKDKGEHFPMCLVEQFLIFKCVCCMAKYAMESKAEVFNGTRGCNGTRGVGADRRG